MYNLFLKIKNKKKAILLTLIILIISFSSLFPNYLIHFIDDIYKNIGIYKFANFDYENNISVHFIDVGQGDAALIKIKDSVLLIDGGDTANSSKLLKYINSMNIKEIDLMVLSHYHDDHMSGLTEIIKNKNVKNIMLPIVDESIIPTTNSYKNFINSIIDKNINIINPSKHSEFKNNNFSIELFNNISMSYKNLNNTSLVLKVKFGEVSFLFTGDIEKEVENYLIKGGFDISSNILKVAHHGSSTSSKSDFISAVNPSYAVISVGLDNKYKHPSLNVLKNFKSKNINIFRTDIDGDIVFLTDGKNINVIKEN